MRWIATSGDAPFYSWARFPALCILRITNWLLAQGDLAIEGHYHLKTSVNFADVLVQGHQ
jgi:hypothetical protein